MVGLERKERTSDQAEVTEKMRRILVDWLVDVHESFELREQTLHLALSYLADYSAVRSISKDEYQLVGIACLWIASKYEEIYPPRTRNYVEVTADSYSLTDLRRAEGQIVNGLDFQLNRTTSLHLLEALAESLEPKTTSFCKYALEQALFHGLTRTYTPSVLVMAALSLCESVFKVKLDAKLPSSTKAPKDQVTACFKELCVLMEQTKNQDLKAIKRKYMKAKYHGVSKLALSL